MSKSKAQSANDQRANSKNPNNAAYQHALDNLSRQLNPNARTDESSRGEDAKPNNED